MPPVPDRGRLYVARPPPGLPFFSDRFRTKRLTADLRATAVAKWTNRGLARAFHTLKARVLAAHWLVCALCCAVGCCALLGLAVLRVEVQCCVVLCFAGLDWAGVSCVTLLSLPLGVRKCDVFPRACVSIRLCGCVPVLCRTSLSFGQAALLALPSKVPTPKSAVPKLDFDLCVGARAW